MFPYVSLDNAYFCNDGLSDAIKENANLNTSKLALGIAKVFYGFI